MEYKGGDEASLFLISGIQSSIFVKEQQVLEPQKFSIDNFHLPDGRPHLVFQRFCRKNDFDQVGFDKTVEANLRSIQEFL